VNTLARAWRLVAPPLPADPRYRVLERRDVREAVRIEIPLVVALMLVQMPVVGFGHISIDILAATTVVVFVALMWGPGRLVQRRPYAAAVVVGMLMVTLLPVAIVDLPNYSALAMGDFAVVVVGAALLVTLNERAHRLWLLLAAIPLIVALAAASISDATRLQGLLVGFASIAVSVAGNSLVQRRRERSWAQVTLLRLQRRELREAVARLQAARATIATLEGVLPICAHCKRIRDADNQWVRVEAYVEQRSAAHFSHGICPDCLAQHYQAFLSAGD
jgi:hypothetical protein